MSCSTWPPTTEFSIFLGRDHHDDRPIADPLFPFGQLDPAELGFDPTVRKQVDFIFSDHAFPGCDFVMPGTDVTISVSVSSSGAFTHWVGCEHIDEATHTVEAALPSR